MPHTGHATSSPEPQRSSLNTWKAWSLVISMTLRTDNVRALAERRKCSEMTAVAVCLHVVIIHNAQHIKDILI